MSSVRKNIKHSCILRRKTREYINKVIRKTEARNALKS